MRVLLCIALISTGCGFDRAAAIFDGTGAPADSGPAIDAGDAMPSVPDAAIDAPAPPACWTAPAYNYSYGGHRYRFAVDDELRGYQAYEACLAEGAYLVAINDANENSFVHTTADEYESLFIGAFDRPTEGNFRWLTDNTDFWQGGLTGATAGGGYANWNSGEPNNAGEEDCAEMRQRDNGRWNDQQCDTEDGDGEHGYVCECQSDLDFTTPAWLGSLQ